MSRNGSGIYSLATGNPVVTGATISSTWANATLNDIATAITGSIASDGQTTVTNNLPMGNYAHTGVAAATVRTMYATAGQAQDSTSTYLTSPAGTNTMTATASLGMSAYVTGQRFSFLAPTTNTGACTLNINSIGIKSITKSGATALVAGDIVSGAIIQVVYDGTQFQILNPISNFVNSFSAGTTGLTPSTSTTGAVTLAGTLVVANGGTGFSSTPTAGTLLYGTGSAFAITSAGTTGQILKSGGTGSPTWGSPITSGTLVASTSGTSVTFSSIPSGVKRITIMFNAVSTSGTSIVQIQIGSTSLSVSGYYSVASFTGSAGGLLSSTSAFIIEPTNSATAANQRFGAVVLTLIDSNTWIASGNVASTSGPTSNSCSGVSPNLSGALTRVDITTSGGTDTFDNGSINIMYE